MQLILAAHGHLAKEVLCSAKMIFGEIDKVDTVDFVPGENAQTLKAKYEALIESYDSQEEILFLVDLFGGSPYNAAFETVLQEKRMDVITGLSLPMLMDIAGLRMMDDELKASEVYEKINAESYIRSCKAMQGEIGNDSEEDDEL